MICANNLKTNALNRPDSLTAGKLRLSWVPTGAKEQTAYQVIIEEAGTIVYDSGKVRSNAFFHEPSFSPACGIQAVWRVRLWDESDICGEESQSTFAVVLGKEDWRAKWITPEQEKPWLEILPIPGQESNPNPAARVRKVEHRNPASYVSQHFTLTQADLQDTILYATAHGIYDIWLNGTHVDGWLLAPGTSQYHTRLMVQAYPVSNLLHEGKNTIVVSLGDGWYRGSFGNDMDINTFGDDVAFLCQIMQGNRVLIATDETWMGCSAGPLTMNDMMRGEVYDARLDEMLKNPEDTQWIPVHVEEYGYDNLIGSDCPPIRKQERFRPVIITTPSGETVLDFGQNFAGFVELRLQAQGGEKIIMTHGETLDENGNFTIANFQNPQKPECFQQVTYICKAGENFYYPTKCYFGFRYVQIESDRPICAEEFTGVAIYSDMEQTCSFTCGNADVNQLFHNTVMSMKSNFIGVPTDCPTREKSGFTGDAQVFSDTALYLMDSYPVFRQWLKEVAEGFLPDDGLRQIAPDSRTPGYFEKSAGWCDAIEIIPWKLWRNRNTLEVPKEEYEAMKRWLNFCIKRGQETRPENMERVDKELLPYFVDMGFHWGEWLEPGANTMMTTMNNMLHGEPEVATAYLSYGCKLMAEMATALGKQEDAAYFSKVSAMAKRAYRQAFLSDGKVRSERQCLYVRPLALGLLEDSEKPEIAAALAKNIHRNGSHLNTGFLSTCDLCRVLTDYGQVETAYDLLLQTEAPGWLYPVRKGATTIWENWNGIAEDGTVRDSLNHYAYGAICGWLVDRVCGINVEFGKIRIQPYPDRRLGFAKAEYFSVYGRIVSDWTYEADGIHIRIEIPTGCTAKIVLPDGRSEDKSCGVWEFTIQEE